MKRSRLVGALATVTAVAAIALLVAGPGPITDTDTAEELLFPDLLNAINEVTRLTTVHEGRELGVEKIDGRWVVPQRAGYPASEASVRKIILAMADIRKLEAMTSKPERYENLGLEPPDDEDAYSVQIELYDGVGSSLGAVVLGYRDPSKVDENSNEIYVRRLDDPQAWLVEADVPHSTNPGDLLDTVVSSLDLRRVREVKTRHAGGHEVIIQKQAPDDANFVLQNKPSDTEVIYDWAINDIGRTFTGLELTDVRPLDEIDFDTLSFTLELQTFDGMALRMESVVTATGHYAKLAAAVVELAPSGTTHEALHSTNAVHQEVDERNAQWGGWAYQFTDYRYGTFTTPMNELVQPADVTSQ